MRWGSLGLNGHVYYWMHIYTKERSLRAMLRWADRDFGELGLLLTKYALGLIGSGPQTDMSITGWIYTPSVGKIARRYAAKSRGRKQR